MQKLEKILNYKERINQTIHEIRDIISSQRLPPPTGDIVKDVLIEEKIRAAPIDNELKKKVDDIIHYLSCIGLLWREDKAGDFQNLVTEIQNYFDLCLNEKSQMKYEALEFLLRMINSLVVPIHESKKWSALIELETMLARIKMGFKNHKG